jgi:hypothetical protein
VAHQRDREELQSLEDMAYFYGVKLGSGKRDTSNPMENKFVWRVSTMGAEAAMKLYEQEAKTPMFDYNREYPLILLGKRA